MDFFQLLTYPFVQRAILAGVISAGLLAILGVFVHVRRMAFFSEGIAHASLAGVAIGILLNQEPLLWAAIWSAAFASAVYILEKKTHLSPDSLIGILFTSSLAFGVLLINLKPGYQPDLISFLFGNILTVRAADLTVIAVAAVLIGAFLLWQFRSYLLLSLNKEMAHVAGLRTELLSFLLYLVLAIAVTLGIKVLGIVLVGALIIIPTATAKLFAGSVRSLLIQSIIFAELAVLIGIALSLTWNLPTGSLIILTGTTLFLASLGVKNVIKA
ncbi:MAG: metal ABC transporter permease [Patescibacteria group bacterium]